MVRSSRAKELRSVQLTVSVTLCCFVLCRNSSSQWYFFFSFPAFLIFENCSCGSETVEVLEFGFENRLEAYVITHGVRSWDCMTLKVFFLLRVVQ